VTVHRHSRVRQYLTGERDPRLLRAAARAGRDPRSRRYGLLADLGATWRLIRAYLRGEYRTVRLRSVLAVVAGLLYFLSPVDLIPDVFVLLGLTDDAVVVSLLFTVVRQELAGFRAWELRARSTPVTVGG
jgi:uncharacterized membrane protein YkvA (DUF1232 family)